MNWVKKRRSVGHVELILQESPAENGAAVLAMVLSYYGKPATVRELMQKPIVNAADLVAATQSRGIYAQGYRMTFAELSRAPLPLIAHWKFRSFVVVTALQGGKVYIQSPENGCQVLSRKAFEEGFTGVAICFAANKPEPQDRKDRSMRKLAANGITVPSLLVAAQLFIAAGYIVLAASFRGIAARLSSPQTVEGISLCLELGLVILLQGAAVAFQIWLIGRCRAFHCARNIQKFHDRLHSENTAFFQRTSRLRLNEAASGCAEGPSAMARSVICLTQLVSGGVCLALMAIQDLAAATAALLVAAAFCAVCLGCQEKLYSDRKLCSRARLLTEEQAARDVETWEANRLRSENGTRFQSWACQAGSACYPAELERQKIGWYIAAAGELLLVFCVCLLEMITGRAGTPDLLGCMVLAAASAASMGALPCLLNEQMTIRQVRENIRQVFRDAPEPSAPSGPVSAKMLTIQNVSLRPAGNEKLVVQDLTFTVRRGEILVVTGNADVRTALAAMLSGVEQPVRGEVYLDNRNTAELSDREICEHISFLGDGVPFPRGTVRENIAAGFSNITDYAVMEAASDALLHQRILLRTTRYDTPVAALSEGERILLEFARAFAKGTPFLVCNDLTRRLDAQTEDQLIRNLRRRGIGTVLLTEDRALFRKGDLVCHIEEGRTVLKERTEIVDEGVYSLA